MADPATSLPWADFITNLQAHKIKVIVIAVLMITTLIGGTIVVNDYFDMKARLQKQEAIASTNSEQMRKIGVDTIAQGQVITQVKTLQDQSTQVLGKQLSDYMTNNNATIRALYTAVGQIAMEIKQGGTVTVTPDAAGGFHGVELTQARTGPATASVNLTYDPKAPDPTKRLTSTWTNYREVFYPSLGEWQKKDNGYVSAFRLRREVWRPDSTAVGGAVKVGDEEINLIDAQAHYNEGNFAGNTGSDVPRWSLIAGAGHDAFQNKTVPVGILGYRATDHFGLHIGQVGNTTIAALSWQFTLK